MGRSYKDIKYDLWYNLEKLGILPGDIEFAVKGNPGSKIFSYATVPLVGANEGTTYKNGGVLTNTSTQSRLTFDNIFSGMTDISIISEFDLLTGSINSAGIISNWTSNSQMSLIFFTGSDGKIYVRTRVTSNSDIITTSVYQTTAGLKKWGFTRAGSTDNREIYVDGKVVPTTVSGSEPGALAAWSAPMYINQYANGVRQQLHANWKQVLVFSKTLSPNRMQAVSNTDIWQPRPDISYFETAAEQPTLLPIYFNHYNKNIGT